MRSARGGEADLEPFDPELVNRFAQDYLGRLQELLARLDLEALSEIVLELENARLEGRTVFIMGNGGSAATASHMALDLSYGTRTREGKRLRAIALTESTAGITAVANDKSYETVFEEQLRALLRRRDVVVAISASGNSPNVLRAIEYSNGQNARTIGLVGFDGGRLKEVCDVVLHVASAFGEYGPVEDTHLIVNHLITSYFIEQG